VASEEEATPEVARHRTAIKRYDLSKPVKTLLERGLLRKQETFFDFGCGHGMDVEALGNLGYQASGWDPAFRPNAEKPRSRVVNLGYVLNVIEEPSERIAALREAFSLAERLLIVSTLVTGQETDAHSRPYRDGFLTKANTFQKFFAPGELESLIESTLDAEVTTLGLGMCVVFRDPDDTEAFEAGRNRRHIDWADLGTQLKFSAPTSRERRTVDRYELHKELFDQFWQTLLELGRLPEPGEFDRLAEVKRAGGGANRALALVVAKNGEQLWQFSRKARAEDALVYLAMTNFRKRLLRREIPLRVKNDIRSFFGDLPTAQTKARDLLFAAGDAGEIELERVMNFDGRWS
jgi:DNA phosphorothioation-associated putative methyltransferase